VKAEELRELANEELAQKSRNLRDEYFNAKVKHSTGQLENSSKLRTLRRDIARVETILREKREASQ